MRECLSDVDIAALATDQPLSRDRAAVDQHMASCEFCRSRLAEARKGLASSEHPTQVMPRASDRWPEPPPPSSIPMVAIDGYDILQRIQGGGQGVVFKALQKSTSRMVAVKVLPHEDTASDRQKQRFEREVSLAASLRHPNIVTIYDSGLTSGRYFFAMEYIHGQPLDEFAGSIDRNAKLVLFAKVCDAVAHAHQQNVVHRDLKPANVLVDARGEPHVLDFGLAKTSGTALLAGPQPITLTSQFMGTLAYASPEQTLGDPMLVDRRSDVYALGVILFEMLTGEFPYRLPGDLVGTFDAIRNAPPVKPSATAGGAGIDRDLDTIVLRSLSKEPARRYQSAEELSQDIHHYLRAEPIAARRDSALYVSRIKARAALRRHPVLTMVGIVVAASLFASNLTPLISRLWAWPARWYEHVAAGNLIGGPPEPGAFEHVRLIGITAQTEASISEMMRYSKTEGISADPWESMRRLHGFLMKRLAKAGVSAVVWDITFEKESVYDADFAEGVQALLDAKAGVAIAMNDWILLDGDKPVMSPSILRPSVVWGGVTMDIDKQSVWKMDVAVQNPGEKTMHSIAVAALAALRHPGMSVTTHLDPLRERLELHFESIRGIEFVPLSAVRSPENDDDDEFGLTRQSQVGMYAVRLPPDDVLASFTREYQDILMADDDDLAAWCRGRVVVVGDLRPPPRGGDWHQLPDGRMVAGSPVQAATIDSLIRKSVPARYLRTWEYLALIAIGALTGASAARGFSRRPMVRIAIGIIAIALIIGLCILAFRATGYVCQPMGPIVAFILAFLAWLWFDSLYSHHPRTEAPGSAGTHSHWRNAP